MELGGQLLGERATVEFHRRARLPTAVHDRIEALGRAAAVGTTPAHAFIEATGEHQLRYETCAFDLARVESETAHFTSRAIAQYRAAATVLVR